MMIRRQRHDDPLGEALAGGAETAAAARTALDTEPPEPVMIDLDAFVTTVGEARPSSPALSDHADDADDTPVVSYDDEGRGGRIYALLHPPRVNGDLINRVTLRLPEQGDIDAFFAGEVSGNRGMICRLSGLHPAVFARLKWPDAAALHQIYRDLVPAFVTGEE